MLISLEIPNDTTTVKIKDYNKETKELIIEINNQSKKYILKDLIGLKIFKKEEKELKTEKHFVEQ